MDWLRRMLRRSGDTRVPQGDEHEQALDRQVDDLRKKAYSVVQHADRTLQEAQRLDAAMRATEQAVRRRD